MVELIAHELAHQWFGNYVTTQWWSALWLNEGFAQRMQFLGQAQAVPALEIERTFYSDIASSALQADALADSLQLTNPLVDSSLAVESQFASIAYDKGGAVLRALQLWLDTLGDLVPQAPGSFFRGVSAYLQAHAYSIMTWGARGTPAVGGGSIAWLYPGGGSANADGTNQIGWEVPAAGTFALMHYSSVTGPTTTGANPVENYTLYVNGGATTLTIAVNAGVTSATDIAHTVTVAAGNRVSMRVISNPGATASSVCPMISVKFSPA